MAVNRQPIKTPFVKYSDKYEDVLMRALKAKSTNVLPQAPLRPFFIRVKSLGMGAYSTVYLVSEERTKTIYALKVVPKSVVKSSRELLEEELKVHMRLNHRNIIQLYHAFLEEGELRMVLQFAEQTLFSLLKRRGGTLSEKEAVPIVKQLLAALAYLHSVGITHRDLKLQNILLLNDEVKLCDFGCARRQKQFDSKEFVGTIDYLSPEVAASKSYSHKTDIWAAGVVLFEMLYGRTLMGDIKENEKYLYLIKFDHRQLQLPEKSSPELKQFFGCIFKPEAERWEASALMEHQFLQQV